MISPQSSPHYFFSLYLSLHITSVSLPRYFSLSISAWFAPYYFSLHLISVSLPLISLSILILLLSHSLIFLPTSLTPTVYLSLSLSPDFSPNVTQSYLQSRSLSLFPLHFSSPSCQNFSLDSPVIFLSFSIAHLTHFSVLP